MSSSSYAEQTITAKYVREGDLIQDELGQKYRAGKVEDCGNGIYIRKAGQGYPEFYLYDHRMTRFTYVADPKPFKVYTRRYLANGDCIKGIREFKTRAAQARYIGSAPDSVAITFYN
jgi:hypothetical protein